MIITCWSHLSLTFIEYKERGTENGDWFLFLANMVVGGGHSETRDFDLLVGNAGRRRRRWRSFYTEPNKKCRELINVTFNYSNQCRIRMLYRG